MSELNINSLGRSLGVEKSFKTPAGQRTDQANSSSAPDSVHLSGDLNISKIAKEEDELLVEEEFAALRERLRSSVESPGYPPPSTIDHLVSILANEIISGPVPTR